MTHHDSRRDSGSPERILRVGLGFWDANTLLSAVELDVFGELAERPLDGEELRLRTGLHPRGAQDFLDALVALGFLDRDASGRYANTPDTARFLVRGAPEYIGGMLEMATHQLYPSWARLTEALRTGEPQRDEAGQNHMFDHMYADDDQRRTFQRAMTSLSSRPIAKIAERFPWPKYRTVADIGCSEGALLTGVLRRHAHLSGTGFDLPPVRPHFEEYVTSAGLTGRLSFRAGDFFADPLPRADVLVFGHVLHDWDLPTKRMLLKKAYEALPADGAVIVFETLIDDERRENDFGLLMSLNMLVETKGGFDYTGADCRAWLAEAGFRDSRVEHLDGPDSMVVGTK
ncbi:acetylserotonin O-methyltransferase [Streptantibioticus rubrisoli]|uniref:Acetylserotonin O-methyltransferase n=1 Tax=Streptantibioticus rubrisoli TaxID=1387313 RepID=A0ABT1P746_9ACTN|nr:acetylserotonin O-methyltransferase [Streptantibioticus rubrisoli]MCQ4041201.1 acetylserotonin O-methyltransferase [Streptantibioticus rubrisoli]